MKNTDLCILLTSLRVCLVIKRVAMGSHPHKWEGHKLVLRYRRSSTFLPPIFSFQHFQITIRLGRQPPSHLLYSIELKNKPICLPYKHKFVIKVY